jgi:hypothetical protein
MESLANVLERHKGEIVDVVTNGGQKLSGIVQEAYEDFFTMSSVMRVYVVPYTGISTLQWPSERPERYPQRRPTSVKEGQPPLTAIRRKPTVRKDTKRTSR